MHTNPRAKTPAANGHTATAPRTTKPRTTKRAPTAPTARNTRITPVASATEVAAPGNEAARATLAGLRTALCERYRPEVAAGAAPIRVMARMVTDLQRQAREHQVPEAIIAAGVINRTIGDVDLRRISPIDDGERFVSLADDMGIALPGEVVGGRVSTGETYRWLHARMLDTERALLARGCDLRMYDLAGTGNPILRERLAQMEQDQYGITLDPSSVFLSLGALDGLDKFWRGWAYSLRQQGVKQTAVVFPAPSFNVPEWQAVSLGYRLHRLTTSPADHFKVTPTMLQQALDEHADIRAFYLTVSNNPTAFAYSYDELRALFAVVMRADREVLVVADLAYIGTGDPAADRTRMRAFADAGILPRTVLVHSFSKTHTLTGDRCGWVGFSDPQLAQAVNTGWINTIASLPAEWQLRYTAYVQLFGERPELGERIRDLYTLRRDRFGAQLRRLNAAHHLFAQVNMDDGGTVYNWSQLRAGEDVFSLFERTGIAGVPGGGFGYTDDFVRFSIGCVPVVAD
jgi:aspartate/methionine/tyrosine aminotransferase